MTSPDDLPVLLARPLAALAHDVAAADVRPRCRLAWWADLLRVLDGGPVPQRELRVRSRVSSRVVTPTLRAFTQRGWVVAEGEPRRKAVRLTERGEEVAAVWRAVPAAVEARWRSSLGAGRVDRLRSALSALVAQLPLELPHYPTTYGFADQTVASALGRDMIRLSGGGLKAGVDHGADWRPVRRATGADAVDVDRLPLYALLSQAFVGFALDYEGEGHGAFEIAATVLRHLRDDGTPLVPPLFPEGLPRKAEYTVPRFALGEVVRDRDGRTDVLHPSERGRAWRDAYEPTVARVTVAWRRSYGAAVVDEVAAAAAALGAGLPPDTPGYPPDT